MKTGQVVSVSNPYPSPKSQNIFGQNTVVDIKVKVDGGNTDTLKEIPALDSLTVGVDGTVVSESSDAMLTEVENLYRTSRQILDSVPLHEKLASTYEGFINRLNPKLAKQKEQEQEIAALKEDMKGMKGSLANIEQLLVALNSKEPKKT